MNELPHTTREPATHLIVREVALLTGVLAGGAAAVAGGRVDAGLAGVAEGEGASVQRQPHVQLVAGRALLHPVVHREFLSDVRITCFTSRSLTEIV